MTKFNVGDRVVALANYWEHPWVPEMDAVPRGTLGIVRNTRSGPSWGYDVRWDNDKYNATHPMAANEIALADG